MLVNLFGGTVSMIRENQYIFSSTLNFYTVFQTYLKHRTEVPGVEKKLVLKKEVLK